MELILLYFWMKLDLLIDIAAWGAFFLLVLFGLFLLSAHDNPDTTKWNTRAKVLFLIGIIPCFLFAVFCPSAKETAVLVAGHYALQFSNSEEGRKVKTLLQITANNILDDAIKAQTRK